MRLRRGSCSTSRRSWTRTHPSWPRWEPGCLDSTMHGVPTAEFNDVCCIRMRVDLCCRYMQHIDFEFIPVLHETLGRSAQLTARLARFAGGGSSSQIRAPSVHNALTYPHAEATFVTCPLRHMYMGYLMCISTNCYYSLNQIHRSVCQVHLSMNKVDG